MSIKPFVIHIPQTEVDELKGRLKHTRWPDEQKNAGWSMGTSLSYLKELVDFWLYTYDWRNHEKKLNELPQFISKIDDIDIHFAHVKSDSSNAEPLLLVHGWPDSFYRFHKVIPLLKESFDIVVPSIPGFGFSERKTVPSSQVADLFVKLVTEKLGYKQFFVSAGDIGTTIVKTMALKYPSYLKAIYLTDVGYPTGQKDSSRMTKEEKAFGGKEELLTNIMVYWFTQTAGSAACVYLLDLQKMFSQKIHQITKISVPTGVTLFSREIQFPKEWAERSFNVQYFKKISKGGHFAALEEPKLFTEKLCEFFKSY